MIYCYDEYVYYMICILFPISSAFLIITIQLNSYLYKNMHFYLRETSNEILKNITLTEIVCLSQLIKNFHKINDSLNFFLSSKIRKIF